MADQESYVQVVSNRPRDDAFHQQKLKMWQPILTPVQVIFIFLAVGISFVPTGVYLSNLNNTIYEDTVIYDGGNNDVSSACEITESNQRRQCTFSFTLTADVTDTLHVYYELDNFYQNHRLYVKSYSNKQLMGEEVDEDGLTSACTSKVKSSDDQILSPCGLIANSMFNDKITFDYENSGHNQDMSESNIAWPSDYDKFKQPEGFESVQVADANVLCNTLYTYPASVTPPSPYYVASSGEYYCYYYPNDDQVQYLYETYTIETSSGSKIYGVDPVLGVTDEHFMVWMRTAARPKFRKLFGRIDPGPDGFKEGQTLYFAVMANFEVASFGGSKAIVISSLSEMGGMNPYLGTAFLVVGILAFLLTLLFIFKQVFSERRKMNGDLSLLRWDD